MTQSISRWERAFTWILIGFVMLLGWSLYFAFNRLGGDVHGGFLPPVSWFAILLLLFFGIYFAVPIWALGRFLNKRIRIVACIVYILPILWLFHFSGSTRRTFIRDLFRVKNGMTYMQVERIMGKWMKDDISTYPPKPENPTVNSTNIPEELFCRYRHTNEGWGNLDWGIVSFNQEGKVVDVELMLD